MWPLDHRLGNPDVNIVDEMCYLLAGLLSSFICQYILSLIFLFSGLSLRKIIVTLFTTSSEESPVFLGLSLYNKSLVVIGFLIRYRLTTSSVRPTSLKLKKLLLLLPKHLYSAPQRTERFT